MKPEKHAAVLIVLYIVSAATAFSLSVEEITNELVCQCGCSLVLENCNHSDCGVAIPMGETIKELISKGETKEQIIAHFVDRYGEIVLAAPTKEGFNLTVWLLPFLGMLGGAAVVTLLIVAWVRRRRASLARMVTPAATGQSGETNEANERIFEEELKDFE